MNQHFYKVPFANAGDVTAVPNPVQGDGSVSYTQGFGPDYSLDPTSDPDAQRIARGQFNQAMLDITKNLQEYQIAGFPEFITAADNGGVAFPYPITAYVRYSAAGDGSDWAIYCSLIANNNVIPGSDPAKWALVTPLSVAAILASQADVNVGTDDSGVVGPTELVRAAREGRWDFVGALTYGTPADLTCAYAGPGGPFTLTAGGTVVFTVAAVNTVTNVTLKVGASAVKALRTSTGDELQPGDLAVSSVYVARYTGAEWRLQVPCVSELRKYGAASGGYIYGLGTSNAAGALTTGINVAVGACRDSTNAVSITLAAPITKLLTAVWAAGTGNGMRDVATALAAGQTWHLFVIFNPAAGLVDVLASMSPTGPVLPAGYTYFRRIWAIVLDPAALIQAYVQTGDYCSWVNPVNDYAGQANGGGPFLRKFPRGVPNGVRVNAYLSLQSQGTNGDANAYFSSVQDPELKVPTAANDGPGVRRLSRWIYPGAWSSYESNPGFTQWTDTAQNMYTFSNDPGDVIAIKVFGYLDMRALG